MSKQKKVFNFTSVNVCINCRRTHLHYDAVKAGYNKCPECIHQKNMLY